MKTIHYSKLIVIGILGTIIVWGLFYVILLSTNQTDDIFSGKMNVTNTNISVNYTITNAKILSMNKQTPNSILITLEPKGMVN